ncbi:MAG: S-layer homology domain-containing protein [Candidatus Margulisiibacteriota bacterium]
MDRKIFFAAIFLAVFLFAQSCFGSTKVANDPSRIGVGARTLGMGKSYVGLADDLTAIFINPAGLASVDQWQLTSMSGKFINEYNYVNFGSAVPTSFGNLGLGYVGSSIGFTAPAATTEVVDGVRIIPSSTEGVTYSFLDSVVLFSWGNELFDNLAAGATLKVFALDLSGPGISQGRASGTELDLGLNYKPSPILKVGLVLQNALPYSAGGKIKWENGTEETLPSLLKPGISLRLLGQEGWQRFGQHELTLNLDGDLAPLRPEIPTLWHLGLEWAPVKLLALRTGIDQDYVGSNGGAALVPTNNLTAGVGLTIGQFRFDYAFHQYNQLTDNDTHYFSLTYGVGEKKEEEKGPGFELLPKDKTILFTSEVLVKGTVLNNEIKEVKVNSADIPVAKQTIDSLQLLRLGKNTILVEGLRGKSLVDRSKIRLLRLKKFIDVAADYWAAVPISILAMENIISGYPDGTFKPEGTITRAEMCALIIKSLPTKEGAGLAGDISLSFPESSKLQVELVAEEKALTFKDVSDQHWARKYISDAVELRIVKGYPDNTFRPNGYITRAEGVSMIADFANLPEPRALEVPFSDVPGRHWAANKIIKAKAAGLLEYLGDKPFDPNKPLTRAEVAEMLSKTPQLAGKVRGLLDWETGY